MVRKCKFHEFTFGKLDHTLPETNSNSPWKSSVRFYEISELDPLNFKWSTIGITIYIQTPPEKVF